MPKWINELQETAFALALHGEMDLTAAFAVPPSMASALFNSKAFEQRQKAREGELKATLSRLEAIVKVLCQLPKAMR